MRACNSDIPKVQRAGVNEAPPTSIAQLPAKVLRDIFDRVEQGATASSMYNPWPTAEYVNGLDTRARVEQRHQLARVCKAWRAIAAEGPRSLTEQLKEQTALLMVAGVHARVAHDKTKKTLASMKF